MSEKPTYPKRWSTVEVVFTNGDISEYTISAAATISRHLRDEAARTGILLLLCGGKTHSIPVHNIREWTITELQGNPFEAKELQVDKALAEYLADPEGHGR